MIDFETCRPQYDRAGNFCGVIHSRGSWPLDHELHGQFACWLMEQGSTLAAWRAEYPAPVPPVPTVAERRRVAYRAAWTDDEFQEAVLESLAGRPEKSEALLAKRETIRATVK